MSISAATGANLPGYDEKGPGHDILYEKEMGLQPPPEEVEGGQKPLKRALHDRHMQVCLNRTL